MTQSGHTANQALAWDVILHSCTRIIVTRYSTNMRIANPVLVAIYTIYIAFWIYLFQHSLFGQIFFVAPCIVIILALIGRYGNWARIVALLIAGIHFLLAVSASVEDILRFYAGHNVTLMSFSTTLIFGAVSGWTIWVLRKPAVRIDGGTA